MIGGGIAGIQTALDIAEAGYPVDIVEKTPSIGGRMSQLDKTFPTLDCSSCILTPKMGEVNAHPLINIYTYSEVESVSGFVGEMSEQEDAERIQPRPEYKKCHLHTVCTGSSERSGY